MRITLCRSLYRLEDIPCKEQDPEWQAEFSDLLSARFTRFNINKFNNLSIYDESIKSEIDEVYEEIINAMQTKYGTII